MKKTLFVLLMALMVFGMGRMVMAEEFDQATVSLVESWGVEPKNVSSFLVQAQFYADRAGISLEKMLRVYGQSGAEIWRNQGLTPYQGAESCMYTVGDIVLQLRLGLLTPAELSRRGGFDGHGSMTP